MGSLAAVAAALIAFLAYALPTGGSTPDPATIRRSPTVSPSMALPTKSVTAPATTSPPSPAPTLTQASGPPAGCQQADAAIATFNKLAGPTWPSRLNAANAMGQDLVPAARAADSAGNSAVSADVSALDQDAGALENYALAGDGSDYNTALATTNTDIQNLNADCGTG